MPDLLKPYQDFDGVVRGYSIRCPGCKTTHEVRTQKHPSAPALHTWGWNGSMERPTFTPSLNTWWEVTAGTEEEVREHWRRWKADNSYVVPKRTHRCHSFIADGVIDFLNDCTHAMRGKHPILEWPPGTPGITQP